MKKLARQPLPTKVSIPSSKINPYKMVIVLQLEILAIFFHYRITTPVPGAYAFWLVSVICKIRFAISWILDQFAKWLPVNSEMYRYSTLIPLKEPPTVTANTILSILDRVDEVACDVYDDQAAMLTFEALSETRKFGKMWAPLCKKYNIEPRTPECFFSQKIDYLKDKVQTSFIKDHL